MADGELTGTGKAGFGAACVLCCAAPMLVIAGVVSFASLLAGGIAVGSVVLVGLSVWALHRRRVPPLRTATRGAVATAGAVLALAGLVTIDESSSTGRSLVSAGVALLACAAVLTLASAATKDGEGCAM